MSNEYQQSVTQSQQSAIQQQQQSQPAAQQQQSATHNDQPLRLYDLMLNRLDMVCKLPELQRLIDNSNRTKGVHKKHCYNHNRCCAECTKICTIRCPRDCWRRVWNHPELLQLYLEHPEKINMTVLTSAVNLLLQQLPSKTGSTEGIKNTELGYTREDTKIDMFGDKVEYNEQLDQFFTKGPGTGLCDCASSAWIGPSNRNGATILKRKHEIKGTNSGQSSKLPRKIRY